MNIVALTGAAGSNGTEDERARKRAGKRAAADNLFRDACGKGIPS
jgi:hypothetical protein